MVRKDFVPRMRSLEVEIEEPVIHAGVIEALGFNGIFLCELGKVDSSERGNLYFLAIENGGVAPEFVRHFYVTEAERTVKIIQWGVTPAKLPRRPESI